ncbi:Protein of unknown function [Gryllus bimaculatus]|nr:Protein of unknown function [Gryllus bimaculatus]
MVYLKLEKPYGVVAMATNIIELPDAVWATEANHSSTVEAEDVVSTPEDRSASPTAPSLVPAPALASTSAPAPTTAPRPPDLPSGLVGRVDEYYSGYEYQDTGTNDSLAADDGEEGEEEEEEGAEGEEEEEEEEAEEEGAVDARGVPLRLPDGQPADADSTNHDLIDSVM